MHIPVFDSPDLEFSDGSFMHTSITRNEKKKIVLIIIWIFYKKSVNLNNYLESICLMMIPKQSHFLFPVMLVQESSHPLNLSLFERVKKKLVFESKKQLKLCIFNRDRKKGRNELPSGSSFSIVSRKDSQERKNCRSKTIYLNRYPPR